MSIELIIALFALIISGISLIVSFMAYKKDHERRQKQSTIEYFEAMTSNLFDAQAKFNDKFSQLDISMVDLENHAELLKDATAVLSAFERLSVGVNAGVFCYDLINRMAGSYLIFLYSRFSPYIAEIRKDASRTRSYKEFEQLVYRIKQSRNPLLNDGVIK